jgi:superfamily I DNA and/or RNA helicase
VAGTAWLLSSAKLEQKFDYLFVDEAGQVSLANILAMSTCAKNIVLLGDQMQLGQPIQGVHPGDSGKSTLDYLLKGEATIAPELGIFLKDTWRMHPEVCRFISEAVYDGRLEAEPKNVNQRLVLKADANPALMPTGVKFLPVEHDGCSQRSEVEAEVVRSLLDSLLLQSYLDRDGNSHAMSLENILVVAPYNQQVNLLKRVLPEGARVGTVDKFQGQEAEAVLVSMTTSSGQYLPRDIEFLYRLNVAVSRARCLAVVVANPHLLEVDCKTPEQMALVNTLCWIRDYSEQLN